MKNIVYGLILTVFLWACKSETKKTVSSENAPVKMILDLDTGIDDAMALAYALGNPKIELIGVTTVFGNVSGAKSIENTLGLLQLFRREEIPVYAGADRAIATKKIYRPGEELQKIHGKNGIGNVTLPRNSNEVQQQSVVDFMVAAAQQYGKELYVVATGPETNLAEVIKKEPRFGKQVGKIVVMGGALRVKGNVDPFIAEANIASDPIAAHQFFDSETPFTMVGLDVTTQTLLTQQETKKWREIGTHAGKVFADIVDYYIDWSKRHNPKAQGVALHDPLAVAVAMHPEFVKTVDLPIKVDTTRGCQLGRTVVAKTELNHPEKINVRVAVDVEPEQFMKNYMAIVKILLSEN